MRVDEVAEELGVSVNPTPTSSSGEMNEELATDRLHHDCRPDRPQILP